LAMKKKSFYILATIVFTLCLQWGCVSKSQPTSDAVPGVSAPIPETILKADALFKQRADISNLREAIKVLAAARTADQRSFEVEWKFAKFNYFLGKQSTDEKESDAAFEKGKDAALIASRVEPGKPDGYFWYGANLGEISRRSPVTIGLRSVGDIQAAMNKVIEIQPSHQNAAAYDALAQIEMATTLTGGKPEKAIELLEKAIEIEKDNTNLRLHLADAYLAVKRKDEARKQLDLLLQMKPNPDYVLEYNADVEKAKKMLETRF
jgi:tetratricopeptide (TPR) repeat protein